MLCIVANNIALVATYIPGRSLTEKNVGDCAVVLLSKDSKTFRAKPINKKMSVFENTPTLIAQKYNGGKYHFKQVRSLDIVQVSYTRAL